MKLNNYKTWIFDCDGVLLDSNHIKTEAFYEVALLYGKNAANTFVKHHKKNTGKSRFEKFQYLHKNILGKKYFRADMKSDLEKFSECVSEKLETCSETDGMRLFLDKVSKLTKCYIVSGGFQEELITICKKKNLFPFFDGIYGSPDTKEIILKKIIGNGKIIQPVIFIGDSLYDYLVSKKFGFDFIFMYGYSEFLDWKQYFERKDDVIIIENFKKFNSALSKYNFIV